GAMVVAGADGLPKGWRSHIEDRRVAPGAASARRTGRTLPDAALGRLGRQPVWAAHRPARDALAPAPPHRGTGRARSRTRGNDVEELVDGDELEEREQLRVLGDDRQGMAGRDEALRFAARRVRRGA